MRVSNFYILENGNMTSALASSAVRLDHLTYFAVQVFWNGSGCAGTLSLQASNLPLPQNDADWTTIANSSSAVTGDSGSQMWNILVSGYKWTRFVYTPTSGSGTMTGILNAKGFY